MSRRARLGESRRPQPHTTNPWEEEKYKIVGDQNKEQIRPTEKRKRKEKMFIQIKNI